MLAMMIKSGKAGIISSLVGISRRLGGPLILPFNMASKRCYFGNEEKVIKGQCGGKKPTIFRKNGRFLGCEVVRGEVDDRNDNCVTASGMVLSGG